VPAVRIARQTRVEGECTDKGAGGLDPDMDWVELPASDIKDLWPPCWREQQVVKAGHGAVVQIRRRRPGAVERPRAIGEQAAELILPSFINLVFRLGVRGRLVLPLLDWS
jgi:hypothetical protein